MEVLKNRLFGICRMVTERCVACGVTAQDNLLLSSSSYGVTSSSYPCTSLRSALAHGAKHNDVHG